MGFQVALGSYPSGSRLQRWDLYRVTVDEIEDYHNGVLRSGRSDGQGVALSTGVDAVVMLDEIYELSGEIEYLGDRQLAVLRLVDEIIGDVVLMDGPFDGTPVINQAFVTFIDVDFDGSDVQRYKRTDEWVEQDRVDVAEPTQRRRVYRWQATVES